MWDGINTHARQSNAVMKLISSWLDYCSGLLADCPTKTNHLWQAVWSTPAHASPRKPLSHHYFACLLSISDDKDRQPHHSYMQKIALMYTCIRRKPQRKNVLPACALGRRPLLCFFCQKHKRLLVWQSLELSAVLGTLVITSDCLLALSVE